ncbi:YheC/YheD family protein [Paenibacillus larvae]
MEAFTSVKPVPALGILSVAHPKRLFMGNHQNFIDLIQTGKELGAEVVVITTSDIHPGAKHILAYTYDFTNKSWTRKVILMPKVIYNRIPNRDTEKHPDVQNTLNACIKNKKMIVFNQGFFDKWTLFEWLKSRPSRIYIPTTKKLTSKQVLETVIQQHPVVYLKPVQGKAGKGIMKIERVTKPSSLVYRLSVQKEKKTQQSLHPSVERLWAKIEGITENNDYIIQQGIQLASYKDRPYDLRALIQKTSKGKWSITGIGARIAGRESITTHVPRGGSIDNPIKLLIKGFGEQKAMRILNRTKRAALELAQQIEKASRQKLGEMSMDLGIDITGKIWFFEANSKPMKFDEPDIRKKSLERIIQYSMFLTAKQKRG